MKQIARWGVCFALAGVGTAQEMPKVAWNLGGGFDKPVQSIADFTNTGWNIRGGVGYNFTPHLSAGFNMGFDAMSLNTTTLNELGFRLGDLHVFSLTLDPVVRLKTHGRVGVYVTGGGGFFRQMIGIQYQVEPAPPPVPTPLPVFGMAPPFNPNTMSPTYTFNKPGVEGGLGITFFRRWRGTFFAEARYVQIWSGSYHTNYIPVTFGFRR